ncbi:hypothetical protein BB347_05965 [Natronorubrum daqingense]|uniref:4Fe-4S ferredoxin-type domain-containing protein n=1 Tax=Natronorubrum daqingense TaxID=588898 RepID=A0A1P8RHM7_9EURY|nr:hypothetical protein BB347_05965 [Natronorubrum daqingense]
MSGPEWEEWAEEVLAETDFDTELGKRLARDAYRIADGDLSKEAFQRRHGDRVEAEFGVDERPTKTTLESAASIPRVPDDHEQSRRSMLKALGAGAAATATAGLAGCLGEDEQTMATTEESNGQLGMTIDVENCIACLQCSEACKEENNTSAAVHWTYVFRWAEDEDAEWDDDHDDSMTRPCQHCTRPTCTYVCPTQARYKREDDGLVLTDYDTCIGCRYCEVACPYGVNYFQWAEPTDEAGGFDESRTDQHGDTVAGNPPEGVMGKCTFCVHRQDSDDPDLVGTTACEDACPADAIHFGDITDPDDAPQRHLEEKSDSNTFELLDEAGNEPNITYVGPEPSSSATPVEGPVSYEEMDMTEHRREEIDARWAGGEADD